MTPNTMQIFKRSSIDDVRETWFSTQKRYATSYVQEVSFMGCLLTDEGMKPDPKKVEAILDMPMPTDVEGVRRLICTAQYL